MNVLLWLAVILFLLMIGVGGRKGLKSFISLFFNFGILFFTVFFMMDSSANPIVIAVIASVFIGCVSLFLVNEVNSRTVLAFLSTMLTIGIMLFFILIVSKKLMIQGFGAEEEEAIGGMSLYIGIDFVKMGAAVIIMSTVGAIMDVAISIAASMHEIYKYNPEISRRKLFQSGLGIGRDILATDTNTLFFAFFGGYLALLIWFKDLQYSIGEIVNSKIFSSELLLIFCGGLGVAFIIPIAAWMNSFYLIRSGN